MPFSRLTGLLAAVLLAAPAHADEWSRGRDFWRTLNAADVPVFASACRVAIDHRDRDLREDDVLALIHQGWSGVLVQVRRRRLRALARFEYDVSGRHDLSAMPLDDPDGPPIAPILHQLRGQWFDLIEEIDRRELKRLAALFDCASYRESEGESE